MLSLKFDPVGPEDLPATSHGAKEQPKHELRGSKAKQSPRYGELYEARKWALPVFHGYKGFVGERAPPARPFFVEVQKVRSAPLRRPFSRARVGTMTLAVLLIVGGLLRRLLGFRL